MAWAAAGAAARVVETAVEATEEEAMAVAAMAVAATAEEKVVVVTVGAATAAATVAATAAAMAAAATAEVAMVVAMVAEATAAETAADRTPRPHSSARHAAQPTPRSWRLHCRRPAQPGGNRLGQPLGNRRTSTQASRRVHSRRHALQAARIVCTTAHRTGRSGHSHPASLLSASSRPSRATSCRKHRTCYRRSSPAPRKSASTDAATVVTAEGVRAAVTAEGERAAVRAELLLRRRRAPSALVVRSASSPVGCAPTFGAGSGTHKQASK